MLCPACKAEMFVLEFEQVEIDYCPDCRGVWLDSGELALIGKRAGALQTELLAALEGEEGSRVSGSKKRRCPICRKSLRHSHTAGDHPIEIDRCPAEHGLWFDRGELPAVVKAAGASADNVLVRFFAKLEKRSSSQPEHAQES